MAYVQSARTNGSGTSLAITPSSAPTNGNAMILMITYNSGTASRVSSISHTGATWTRAHQSNNAGGISVEAWYSLNASSAGATITANMAASLNIEMHYLEFSDIATVSALDQIGATTETGSGGEGG